MNVAQLIADIEAKKTTSYIRLQLPFQREEELKKTNFRDVRTHELRLIMKFMNMYLYDFIERYNISEDLLKIYY